MVEMVQITMVLNVSIENWLMVDGYLNVGTCIMVENWDMKYYYH